MLLLAFVVCVIAAFFDLRTGTIPNRLTYPVLVAAPFLHLGRGLAAGMSIGASLAEAGLSLLGVLVCGAIPAFMWLKNGLGGGDLKLFAALGALLLPRVGFDAELYVFLTAALIAPAKLAYEGTLFRALRNIGWRMVHRLAPGAGSYSVDPSLVSWFRMGPCFAIGLAIVVVLNYRSL